MRFILTINGGPSSSKCALFKADNPIRRILERGIVRSGLTETTLQVNLYGWVNGRNRCQKVRE